MNQNQPVKTNEELKKELQEAEDKLETIAKKHSINSNPYSRKNIIDSGTNQFKKLKEAKENRPLNQNDDYFQMMTLYEFDNALLLTHGCGEAYKTLAVDLSQQLQMEYDCKTPSERATAHLAAQNYVRTIELQKNIANNINADSYNDLTLKRLAILEKSYDRANQQYLLSIQVLKSLKQPPINLTVKAQTANVANQQLIKQDNYEA